MSDIACENAAHLMWCQKVCRGEKVPRLHASETRSFLNASLLSSLGETLKTYFGGSKLLSKISST